MASILPTNFKEGLKNSRPFFPASSYFELSLALSGHFFLYTTRTLSEWVVDDITAFQSIEGFRQTNNYIAFCRRQSAM